MRNIYEYSDTGTHWIALYALNNVTYFDSFGVEHIPKEIKKFMKRSLINKSRYLQSPQIFIEYKHMIQ